MIHIGILDDNKTHLQITELALIGSSENWDESVKVSVFTDGQQMIESLKSTRYDCLVIDRHIPGMDDEYILKWSRVNISKHLPIIVLTSNRNFTGAAHFLGLGADDYIIKPVNPAELLLRVKRVIAHNRKSEESKVSQKLNGTVKNEVDDELFKKYGVILDNATLTVNHSSQLIHLTDLEFRLAKLFFANIGETLAKEDVFRAIWPKGSKYDQRLLSTHICRIRNKIDLSPSNKWVLRVVYGFGYRLDYRHAKSYGVLNASSNEL